METNQQTLWKNKTKEIPHEVILNKKSIFACNKKSSFSHYFVMLNNTERNDCLKSGDFYHCWACDSILWCCSEDLQLGCKRLRGMKEASNTNGILPCLLRPCENKCTSFLANYFWGLTNKLYFKTIYTSNFPTVFSKEKKKKA